MRRLFDKFDFVVVYMDDICVFLRTIEEHADHLRSICTVVRTGKLYARPSKCSFGVDSVNFLGHTISKYGLHVDQSKVCAIEKWPEYQSSKDVMSFVDLPVTTASGLLKRGDKWHWSEDEHRAYLTIKFALQQAPALQLPEFNKPFVVTSDASGFCCDVVISQLDGDGNDRSVAFMSKRLGPHEQNWPTHEKELYAIKLALSKWRHYLHGNRFD
ncbi:hypothetical protein AaE_006483, partial [Aphanomyces astaci]